MGVNCGMFRVEGLFSGMYDYIMGVYIGVCKGVEETMGELLYDFGLRGEVLPMACLAKWN